MKKELNNHEHLKIKRLLRLKKGEKLISPITRHFAKPMLAVIIF